MKRLALLVSILVVPLAAIAEWSTGTVHGSASSAASQQQFYVSQYGAISNDGLEDHTAINAAVDAACAVGGGVINAEPGAIYEVGAGASAYLGIQLACGNLVFQTPFG